MNARKLRFPVLIGAGVVAAGVLLYQSNSRIDSSQTRGEIAQRDVYRDSQVNPEDVNATPGNAPVAAKVLLESKEFKTLANNPAYHELLASQSFEAMAHNHQFLAMLANPSFAEMSRSKAFTEYLKGDVLARSARKSLDADVRQDSAPKKLSADVKQDATQDLRAKKLQADLRGGDLADELNKSRAFHDLIANSSFQSLVRSHDLSQHLARVMSMGSFADLVNNSALQSVLARSEFREALRTDLSANLKQSAAKK